MKNIVLALLGCALFSCGGHSAQAPAGELAATNFDALDGWMNGATVPSLTRDKAHSGAFSAKVDPSVEYSLGYNNQLGKLKGSQPLHKLRLHGWVFLPNDKANVKLVTEVKNPTDEKAVVWDGLDLLKEVKDKSAFNKWVEIDHTVTVPDNATFASQVKVYLWRDNSSQPAYLDDLQLLRAE